MDDVVVLLADLTVAQEDVVDLLALEVGHDLVGVVGAGGLDGLEVVHRRRVVRSVGEGRTGLGLGREPVREGAVLLVEVPVPGVGELGALELVDTERVDVGDEEQADGQLGLALEPGLVELLDEVDQVAAGVHRADDVRVVGRGLGDVGGEVVVGERRRDALPDGAAGLGHLFGERLLHVLAEGVVGVDEVPLLAARLGDRWRRCRAPASRCRRRSGTCTCCTGHRSGRSCRR